MQTWYLMLLLVLTLAYVSLRWIKAEIEIKILKKKYEIHKSMDEICDEIDRELGIHESSRLRP